MHLVALASSAGSHAAAGGAGSALCSPRTVASTRWPPPYATASTPPNQSRSRRAAPCRRAAAACRWAGAPPPRPAWPAQSSRGRAGSPGRARRCQPWRPAGRWRRRSTGAHPASTPPGRSAASPTGPGGGPAPRVQAQTPRSTRRTRRRRPAGAATIRPGPCAHREAASDTGAPLSTAARAQGTGLLPAGCGCKRLPTAGAHGMLAHGGQRCKRGAGHPAARAFTCRCYWPYAAIHPQPNTTSDRRGPRRTPLRARL